MHRQKEFIEFVTKNPPPCVPGDRLFWFDPETGEIKESTHAVESVVLTDKWEWKIIDEYDKTTLIIPNEDPYYCITAEDAKKFRDRVEQVRYAVFKPDANGKVIIDDKPFSILKIATLKDIASLRWYEDYIVAIMKRDEEVELGMALKFERTCYMLTAKGKVDEVYIDSIDKETRRILEDAFEEI